MLGGWHGHKTRGANCWATCCVGDFDLQFEQLTGRSYISQVICHMLIVVSRWLWLKNMLTASTHVLARICLFKWCVSKKESRLNVYLHPIRHGLIQDILFCMDILCDLNGPMFQPAVEESTARCKEVCRLETPDNQCRPQKIATIPEITGEDESTKGNLPPQDSNMGWYILVLWLSALFYAWSLWKTISLGSLQPRVDGGTSLICLNYMMETIKGKSILTTGSSMWPKYR